MFQNRFRVIFLNQIYKDLDKSIISIGTPSVSTGISVFSTPIKEIFYPGNSLEFSDLNIRFQLEEDYTNWKIIMDWIYDNKNFNSVIANQIFSDVSIQFADSKKNFIYSIELTDCFPYEISSIDFSTRITEIDPLEFDVMFKINNLSFKER